MKTIITNGHKIEIKGWGKEKIYYDGNEVSSKWSTTGGTHIFEVNENNEQVQYEVSFGTRWHGFSYWVEVRRNGKIIFTDR